MRLVNLDKILKCKRHTVSYRDTAFPYSVECVAVSDILSLKEFDIKEHDAKIRKQMIEKFLRLASIEAFYPSLACDFMVVSISELERIAKEMKGETE